MQIVFEETDRSLRSLKQFSVDLAQAIDAILNNSKDSLCDLRMYNGVNCSCCRDWISSEALLLTLDRLEYAISTKGTSNGTQGEEDQAFGHHSSRRVGSRVA